MVLILIEAGAIKPALLTGLLIETVGATLGLATETVIEVDEVTKPPLSVAFAVSE